MNKELNKSKFTVIFVSVALIVSVFVFFMIDGSVAWFAGNHEVSADNMSVKVAAPESIVEGDIEYFDIAATTLVTLPEGASPDADQNRYKFLIDDANTAVRPLKTYSIINDKMQILIKITFKSYINIESVGVYALSTYTGDIIPTSADGNVIDPIIKLSVFSGNQVKLYEEADGSRYYVIDGYTEKGNGSFSKLVGEGNDRSVEFTSGEDITIAQGVDISVADSSSITDSESGTLISTLTEKTLFIILDYERDVAQYVKESIEYENAGLFGDDNILNYTQYNFTIEIKPE